MTVMEIQDSADVKLDFRVFPVIPVQWLFFFFMAARVRHSVNIPFQQAYPKIQALFRVMKFFCYGDVFIRESSKTHRSQKRKTR